MDSDHRAEGGANYSSLVHWSGKPRPGAHHPWPVYLRISVYLFGGLVLSDRTIAGAAINRPALSGLERHFGLFSTLCTNRREFLHRSAGSTITALPFPGLAAGQTTLGFIGVTLCLKEFLLGACESKLLSAIYTRNLLVTKTH